MICPDENGRGDARDGDMMPLEPFMGTIKPPEILVQIMPDGQVIWPPFVTPAVIMASQYSNVLILLALWYATHAPGTARP
jgi:hypothetical protein